MPTQEDIRYNDLRDLRAQLDRQIEAAHKSRTVGLVGIIVGLILVFVFWPAGVFLLLAGILASVTQIVKRNDLQTRRAEVDKQITNFGR